MHKKMISGKHNLAQFENALKEFEDDDEIKSIIIFSAADTPIQKNEYDPILKKSRLNIIGGIFPEILYEGTNDQEGTIMLGLSRRMETLVLEKMDDEDEIIDQIEEVFSKFDPTDKSFFIFTDALVGDKSLIFDSLYNNFGTIPRYIGAGAGSLAFEPFACVYSNDGLISSGAVIAIANIKSQVGVAHGWEAISEPLKVTESSGNQIVSLNWKPAMEVYKEIVEQHSGVNFDFGDFFNSSKSYPFGISKLDSEKIVRDPFKQEQDVIFTLDNVDQGSHVTVMYGNKESLLNGATEAYNGATTNVQAEHEQDIIIDCISRVLFLGEDFAKEMQNLDPEKTCFGALTLGEIANNGDAYLEVYNKTAVVCKLYE